MIYFIREKESGCIRIGQCSKPEAALRNVQGGNPRKLRLVAVLSHRPVSGSPGEEDYSIPDMSLGWVKAKFRKHRVRGSWFEEEAVLTWLRGKCAANFLYPDYTLLPERKRYRRSI